MAGIIEEKEYKSRFSHHFGRIGVGSPWSVGDDEEY